MGVVYPHKADGSKQLEAFRTAKYVTHRSANSVDQKHFTLESFDADQPRRAALVPDRLQALVGGPVVEGLPRRDRRKL